MRVKKLSKLVGITFLGFLLCGCNSNQVQEEKNLPESNIVDLYSRESVDKWIKENYIYLNLAFDNCAYGRTESKNTYEKEEDKLRVLTAYLQTYESEEVTTGPGTGIVKKDRLLALSKEIFENGINLEELKEITKEDNVSLTLNTGVGVSLPSFWKFEKEENDVYTIYIADFACSIKKEENMMSIYQPGASLKEEDLKKYNPGIIKIKFKHTKDKNYIISSSFNEKNEFN